MTSKVLRHIPWRRIDSVHQPWATQGLLSNLTVMVPSLDVTCYTKGLGLAIIGEDREDRASVGFEKGCFLTVIRSPDAVTLPAKYVPYTPVRSWLQLWEEVLTSYHHALFCLLDIRATAPFLTIACSNLRTACRNWKRYGGTVCASWLSNPLC